MKATLINALACIALLIKNHEVERQNTDSFRIHRRRESANIENKEIHIFNIAIEKINTQLINDVH